MKKFLTRTALAGTFAIAFAGAFASPALDAQIPFRVPEIPYERYTLANGLTVILVPDHSAPVVAIDVWYHVGSKNEKPGRTGFAHLFEHVMFQGSEHIPYGGHIKMIEDAGGRMNGSTEADRTNYYETMPSNQLETALWLESDRMGYLLPALDQAKLDAQRDVVKNERRQGVDNVPYGSADEVLGAVLFPANNPYSWPVIGSMADLSAASLDDVKDFFRTYYVPGNATIAVAGDMDVAKAKALIAKYFGPIPAGPHVVRPSIAPVVLSTEKRIALEDVKAELPRLQIVWPVVGRLHSDAVSLEALARVLTQDRTSRLTKLLVYDRQLATGVIAYPDLYENAGRFVIDVTPRPNASLTEIEQLIDSTLASLASASPTVAEVDRSKSSLKVGLVVGLDGAMNKAETLLDGQTYFGDPLAYVARTRAQLALTPDDVARAARAYLTRGRVVLSMVPAGKLALVSKPTVAYTNVTPTPESVHPTKATTFDRRKPPTSGSAGLLNFPKAQQRTLRNGASLVVLEDHSAPVVSVSAVIDVSPSLEPAGKTGIDELVRQMLAEGTTTRNADQLADAVATLGNSVSPFGFYTITANLDRSLELMADQLLRPAFPEAAFKRLATNRIAAIRRSREDPAYLATRVLANALYGTNHLYSRTPTEAGVASITRDDVVRHYSTYYCPPNVTFVVAGDITPARAVDQLNRAFGTWVRGASGRTDVPVPHGTDSAVVYLYDRPGASQSVFAVGALGPRRDASNYFATQLMSTALGGAFNSRINLNLREQHHYSYGAFAGFSFRRVPEVSTFLASASVETLKTDSALVELVKELRDVRGKRLVSAEELAFARRLVTTGMPLQFETIRQRADAITRLIQLHLPTDYYGTAMQKFDAVTLDDVRNAADRYVDPSKMPIVVVGDRRVIEPLLRAAKIAPIVVVGALRQ